MEEKKTKNFIIIALCLTLMVMGIGFAVLSQNIDIKSTATISSTWDIHYDSFVDNTSALTSNVGNQGSVPSDGISLDADKRIATVKFNLVKPGDQVQFKGIIKNFGSIKALLSTFNIPGDGTYIDRTVTINGTAVTIGENFKVTAPANLVLVQNDTAEVVITYTYLESAGLPEFNKDTNSDGINDTFESEETLTFGFVQK